jgi:hypothetical protein
MSRSALHRGLPRASRGAFVAALTLTLSSAAHVLAGGSAPTAASVAGLGVVFAPLCWLISREQWSVRQLVAVFLLAQSAMHMTASFDAAAAHTLGPTMVTTHLLAVVVLVLAVTRGERTLVRLLDLITVRFARLRAVAVPVVVPSLCEPVAARCTGRPDWSDAWGRAPPTVNV